MGEDLDAIRARLVARKDESFARLEDAASELWSVHGVPEEEILARVRVTIGRDRGHAENDSATA